MLLKLKALNLSRRSKILLGILMAVVIGMAGHRFAKSTFFQKPAAAVPAPKATRQPQEDLDTALRKAEELVSQNRLDEALQTYQAALTANPNNARLHNDIGYILLEKNLLVDSEKHLILAAELNPDCSECANNLGILRTRQGKTLEAEKHFKEAIILNETYPEPYYNLGVLYEKNGDTGNAVVLYNDFLRHSTDKKSIAFLQVENRILVLGGK